MNVREFEYIAEIAAQESISKAAARLYLSQPTLTKFLKKIEDELETPLFYRIGKRMIPTPAGTVCIERSRQILQLHRQMNAEIQHIREQDTCSIRIGASASRGEFFISRILPEMTRLFPKATFHLSLEAKSSLMRRLENDELDVIFVNNAVRRPYLEYFDIAVEEMALIVPDGHPLLEKAVPSPHSQYPRAALADWISYPFIIANESMNSGQYARTLFQHFGQTPPIVLELGSISLIYSAVRQNIGISIVPSMPQFESTPLHYLSFDDDRNIQWHFTAIKKPQHGPALLTELIQLVKEQYYR